MNNYAFFCKKIKKLFDKRKTTNYICIKIKENMKNFVLNITSGKIIMMGMMMMSFNTKGGE